MLVHRFGMVRGGGLCVSLNSFVPGCIKEKGEIASRTSVIKHSVCVCVCMTIVKKLGKEL